MKKVFAAVALIVTILALAHAIYADEDHSNPAQSPSGTPPWIEYLKSGDEPLAERVEAAENLYFLTLKLLESYHFDPQSRINSIFMIGEIFKTYYDVFDMEENKGDVESGVLKSKIETLVSRLFSDSDLVSTLKEAASDQNPDMRELAVKGMGRTRHPIFTDSLVNAFADEYYYVITAAVTSLGKIKAQKSISAIGELYKEALAESERTRKEIKSRKDPKALKDLEVTLLNLDFLRLTCIWSLGQMESMEAKPYIEMGLSDADEKVRKKAEEGLQKLGN